MRLRFLSIPALAALLFLAACDLGLGSRGDGRSEPAAPPTPIFYDIGSDLEYIDLMVPHHQLAVDMARIAEQKAVHGELKGMARDIIWVQEDEINRLNIWRKELASGDSATTTVIHSGSGGHGVDSHTMGMDVDLDLLASSPNFDRDFIKAMLPHHQSAIDMSRSAMPNLKKVEVRDLATDIITTQQTEIDRMLGWLEEWK